MVQEAGLFTRDMILQLEECARRFYERSGASFFEAKTSFAGKVESYDNVERHDVDIYFNNHVVRFSYFPRVYLSMYYSNLTCFISFEKAGEDKVFYPLFQLYGFFKEAPADALVIPLILNAEAMKESFEQLEASLKGIWDRICGLSYHEEGKAALFSSEVKRAIEYLKSDLPTNEELSQIWEEAKLLWFKTWKREQEKNFDLSGFDEADLRVEFEWSLERFKEVASTQIESDKRKLLFLYYHLLLSRLLSAGYEAYMTGNYSRALKKLKKLKIKTAFDECIMGYLQGAAQPRPHVPPTVFESMTKLYKNGMQKNSMGAGFKFVLAGYLFGLLWLPFFLGVYFLFYFIEGRDALYLMGSLSNAPVSMFPCFLIGMLMIYFKPEIYYKIFYRKNYQRLMELERASFNPGGHRFMKGFAGVVIAGCIVFLFLTVHQNLKLTEEGIIDNTRFWNLKGSFYTYEEVDRVYYKETTTSQYGEDFPEPSYVIRLKDGSEIDPYLFDTCNEKFLEVLRSKGVAVEWAP